MQWLGVTLRAMLLTCGELRLVFPNKKIRGMFALEMGNPGPEIHRLPCALSGVAGVPEGSTDSHIFIVRSCYSRGTRRVQRLVSTQARLCGLAEVLNESFL